MSKPRLTVIFDKSSFHGARLGLLRESPLLALMRLGVVQVHHTPVLLEETMAMYEQPANRDALRVQLPFILDICNGRWFRQADRIWHTELVANHGVNANVFEKGWRRTNVEKRIRAGALGQDRWAELEALLPFRAAERAKQKKIREIHGEMRAQLAQAFKTGRYDYQQRSSPLAFIQNQLEEWGTLVITKFIGQNNKSALVERWRDDKQRYPFLTSYLEGQIYSDWYAMLEHNKKIDLNAHVDVQLLTYLNRADVVVSADEGFLRDAFQTLWQPKGKRLYTPTAFVDFLSLFVPR